MMRPRRGGIYNIQLPTYIILLYTYYCSFTCTVVPVPTMTHNYCVIIVYRYRIPDMSRAFLVVRQQRGFILILVDVAARLTFVFRPYFQLHLARCTTGVYCPPGPYGWAPSSYPTTTINHCRRQVRLRARRRWDIHKYSITIIMHMASTYNYLIVI